MRIKYYEERKRASGQIVHVVNPPKYVREAIGATYRQFDKKEAAISHALEVANSFQDYRRNKDGFQFVDKTTVEGLVHFYMTTKEFKELAPGTKIHYRGLFKHALETRIGSSNRTVGEMYSRNITTTHVDQFYIQTKEQKSPTIAWGCMKVMRRAWNVGHRNGLVTANPWEKANLKSLPVRTVTWTPEQVDTLINTADEIGLPSIGTLTMLCYHLCQRPGDMRQLTWGNYKDGVFTFTQEKTKVDVEVDASPDLQERLAQLPRGAADEPIVIFERTGRPYGRGMSSMVFREVRDAAGLPETLYLSDLRRTGATEMALAGATEDELRSVTGHKDRAILEVYIRPSRHMARNAVNKRFKK